MTMKIVRERLNEDFVRNSNDKLTTLGVGQLTFTKDELEELLGEKVNKL